MARRQHPDEGVRNGVNGIHSYVYDEVETKEDIRLFADDVDYFQVKCAHCGDYKSKSQLTRAEKKELKALKKL